MSGAYQDSMYVFCLMIHASSSCISHAALSGLSSNKLCVCQKNHMETAVGNTCNLSYDLHWIMRVYSMKMDSVTIDRHSVWPSGPLENKNKPQVYSQYACVCTFRICAVTLGCNVPQTSAYMEDMHLPVPDGKRAKLAS